MNEVLGALTRKPDRGGDRALLDDVFDSCLVATVSTVIGDEPWSVPTLVARDGDRLLLHGSTGAGAFRHIAAGAKVAVCGYIVDALVIAERAFDHSANYRSAVVRGVCRALDDDEKVGTLDLFTDALLPGRPAECPPRTVRELAQTLVLELPIEPGNWLAKQRTGPAAPSDTSWTGLIPVSMHCGDPVSDSAHPVPPSVSRRVVGR